MERFRNFKLRLETSRWEAGANPEIAALAQKAVRRDARQLDDDLNTAQALAAIFDLVRDANAAADHGKVKQDDIAALLDALYKFDEIFAVLADSDAAHVKSIVDWARAEGLEDKITPEAAAMAQSAALSDPQVEELVAKHRRAQSQGL